MDDIQNEPLSQESSARPDEDTRERLLKAAAQLFAENGYEGTSVKELAQAAGVNVSLVSYHFGGKEGLFKTCLEQVGLLGQGVTQRILKEPPASPEDFRTRLKLFVQELFEIQLSKPFHTRILHRECDRQVGPAQEVFRTTFHPVFETLVSFFAGARQKGLIRADIDPGIATTLFFGAMMHPIRMQHKAQEVLGISIQDPAYREKIVDHLVGLFTQGLGAPTDSART